MNLVLPEFSCLTGDISRYGIRKSRDSESASKLWRKKGAVRRLLAATSVISLLLTGCQNNLLDSFPRNLAPSRGGGIVVADEPQAVVVARNVLDAAGSAADAAVALGFALSVTLQSSAGLGGGGLCLVRDVDSGRIEMLDFTPRPATGNARNARWQVSTPAMSRGLFALHSKYGKLPWQALVVQAENLARFGVPVTRAMARDLAMASDSLVNDPDALDQFSSTRRTMLAEGDQLVQLELAATLGRIRAKTPGDFYAGALSRLIEQDALEAGVSVNASDLRSYSPQWVKQDVIRRKGIDFHIGTSAMEGVSIIDAFDSEQTSISEHEPAFAPASTGFVVADANGNTVACTLTMDRPFGVGLLLDRTGFLLAPGSQTISNKGQPLIALIAVEQSSGRVVFMSASGGAGSLLRSAQVAKRTLLEGSNSERVGANKAVSFPSGSTSKRKAQVNTLLCENGVIGGLERCSTVNDPLGLGYGVITYGER